MNRVQILTAMALGCFVGSIFLSNETAYIAWAGMLVGAGVALVAHWLGERA